MADFMTVLAASQKQTPSVARDQALGGWLPESLFENVLSAQMGAELEGEVSTLALPLALSDQITLADKPADKISPPAMDVGTDAAVALALVLPAVSDAQSKAKFAEPTAAESAPVAARVARGMQSKLPVDMTATSAASGAGQRQELPLPQQMLAAGDAQSAALLETAAETLPLQAVAGGLGEAVKPPDPSVLVAARQLGQFEHLARTTEIPVRATVEAPVRGQAFPAEFSEKIVWLVGRQAQVADLSLNPPQLGSLEVRLSLSGNEAGAQFYSPHPQVRDAIEAALPRLRELMAQAGIALGDAQVRDEAFARGETGGFSRAGNGAVPSEGIASLAPVVAGATRAGLGLIDLYA